MSKLDMKSQALALAAQGLNRKQIAEAVGCTWPSVDRWLKAVGVQAVAADPPEKVDRNAAIRVAYEAGKKAADVGREFGISCARVCMLLRRQGVALRGRGGTPNGPKRPPRPTLMDLVLGRLQAAGVDLYAFPDLGAARAALRKFVDQRERSITRGIGWDLTFPQWWGVWAESGQWAQRGRSGGSSAVMARMGDVGPYQLGNVYITTLAKNFVDSHLFRGHRIRGEASKAAVLSSCPFEPLNTTQQSLEPL